MDYWKLKAATQRQQVLDSTFAGAGIPENFRSLTIDTMIERCGKDPQKKAAIEAVRQYIEKGYVEDPNSKRYKRGIILCGEYGRGKTGLLTPALRHAVENGKVGLWIETYDFIDEVQAGYKSGNSQDKLKAAQQADIILLDDFGDKNREGMESDDRRKLLYQLINFRHNEGLPMLITSNLTAAELSVQFGQRTVERVIESCAWLKLGGANLRL